MHLLLACAYLSRICNCPYLLEEERVSSEGAPETEAACIIDRRNIILGTIRDFHRQAGSRQAIYSPR